MKKLLLIGGGGHCKSIIDVLHSSDNSYHAIGIVDRSDMIGKKVCGISVVGTDDDLKDLYEQGYKYAFVAIGSVGDSKKRIEIYHKVRNIGFCIPNIIDSSCIIGRNTLFEEGIFIGKGAVINVGTSIGCCTIINTSCIIEHDCTIGNFVHTAPGSVICGGSVIGDCSHIGANSSIIQGINVGSYAVVGAGSVIIRDVESKSTVIGNPGRKIKGR